MNLEGTFGQHLGIHVLPLLRSFLKTKKKETWACLFSEVSLLAGFKGKPKEKPPFRGVPQKKESQGEASKSHQAQKPGPTAAGVGRGRTRQAQPWTHSVSRCLRLGRKKKKTRWVGSLSVEGTPLFCCVKGKPKKTTNFRWSSIKKKKVYMQLVQGLDLHLPPALALPITYVPLIF